MKKFVVLVLMSLASYNVNAQFQPTATKLKIIKESKISALINNCFSGVSPSSI